mmetsp:Transcript_75298/g.137806  ORF Transcript_75298/g.137806 Transcript_75298/m.137806 type:complete len:529 (-) Transcript_75298:110-1696(-)
MALMLAPACQRALLSRWYKPQEYSSVLCAIVKLGFEAGQHKEIDGIVEASTEISDAFLQELTPHGITSLLYAVTMFCNNGYGKERYQRFAARICDKACRHFENFRLVDLAHLYDTICNQGKSVEIDRDFVRRLLQEVRDVAAVAALDDLQNLASDVPGLSWKARQALYFAIIEGMEGRAGSHPTRAVIASAFFPRVFHGTRLDSESSDDRAQASGWAPPPGQGSSFLFMNDTDGAYRGAGDGSHPRLFDMEQQFHFPSEMDEAPRSFPSPDLDYREPPDLMVRHAAASFGRTEEEGPRDIFASDYRHQDTTVNQQTSSNSSSQGRASWQGTFSSPGFIFENPSLVAQNHPQEFSYGGQPYRRPYLTEHNQEPMRRQLIVGATAATRMAGWASIIPQTSPGQQEDISDQRSTFSFNPVFNPVRGPARSLTWGRQDSFAASSEHGRGFVINRGYGSGQTPVHTSGTTMAEYSSGTVRNLPSSSTSTRSIASSGYPSPRPQLALPFVAPAGGYEEEDGVVPPQSNLVRFSF